MAGGRVVSRRAFLAGAAGAVAGVAGVAGACSGRVGPFTFPGTSVVSGRLVSSYLRRSVGWTLSVPSGTLAGVVYCLHGKGDDHRYPFKALRLPTVAADAAVRLAFAAVDGGADSYWHRRADSTDAQLMLFDEFMPLIEGRLGSGAGGLPRALLGWSMGGYGALLAAETRPASFAAVAVASPALWLSPGSTAPGAFDSAADYRSHDVFAAASLARLGPPRMHVRVDCGRSDPFYRTVRSFVARLPAGWDGSFGPGHHGAAYWRSVAPAQVAWLGRALGAGPVGGANPGGSSGPTR
jgi:enterochelin esterase-like enzyme